MRSVVINQPATYPARPIHGALVSGFVAVHLDKSVFPARYLRTLRDLDYEIDLDLAEVRDRPDILFAKLHELLGKRERLLDVLWGEEKWNLMQVVVTGTDRLHHFLFDAYDDPAHPHHGAFLDYYRAVDAFVGRVYDRFGPQRMVYANFFETRATEYSKAATKGNWNEVWSSFDQRRKAKKGDEANDAAPDDGPGLFGDDGAGGVGGAGAQAAE